MLVSTVTVVLNMILAPFLIFGWVTGRAFGVAGAAMSSLVAIVFGIVWLATYFVRDDTYLHFEVAQWRPRLAVWKRMLAIGLPTGFEFGVTALYLAIVYSIARPFGAAAQAGFGIGMRVVQAGFMPVVALGFSVAPVAGQNFGARLASRVKATFRQAAWMAVGAMLLLWLVCQLAPEPLVGVFSRDPAVIAIGAEYLRIISWGFVGSGLIFVASSMFQAMGNTVPSLVTSGARILLVAIPAVVMSRMPGFQLRWLWYLSLVTGYVQLALSMLLLRREYGRRLAFGAAPSMPAAAARVAGAD
jgi:Na+-driven multidrug efflux pump